MSASTHEERVLGAIEREGMILVQDARLPSLATMVAGEPISGSWWGHSQGKTIFNVIEAIEDDRDVARFKLLDGKVCLVHRALWPSLACIGRSRQRWQLEGLSTFASDLYERVERGERVEESGPHVKELETRLLCVGDQRHTESGAHVTELVSWKVFAKEHGVSLKLRSADKAKAQVEAIVGRWATQHGRRAKLPWP